MDNASPIKSLINSRRKIKALFRISKIKQIQQNLSSDQQLSQGHINSRCKMMQTIWTLVWTLVQTSRRIFNYSRCSNNSRCLSRSIGLKLLKILRLVLHPHSRILRVNQALLQHIRQDAFQDLDSRHVSNLGFSRGSCLGHYQSAAYKIPDGWSYSASEDCHEGCSRMCRHGTLGLGGVRITSSSHYHKTTLLTSGAFIKVHRAVR